MSRNDVILGVAALVLVVFSLVVSLVIPRRDAGFPGRNIRVFTVVAVLLVVAMLAAVEVFGEAHESEGAEHTESGETDTGQQATAAVAAVAGAATPLPARRSSSPTAAAVTPSSRPGPPGTSGRT